MGRTKQRENRRAKAMKEEELDNIRRLQAGHAQNVRRGSGEEADLLLADLVITDERLMFPSPTQRRPRRPAAAQRGFMT